jgi:hypothetical protein
VILYACIKPPVLVRRKRINFEFCYLEKMSFRPE